MKEAATAVLISLLLLAGPASPARAEYCTELLRVPEDLPKAEIAAAFELLYSEIFPSDVRFEVFLIRPIRVWKGRLDEISLMIAIKKSSLLALAISRKQVAHLRRWRGFPYLLSCQTAEPASAEVLERANEVFGYTEATHIEATRRNLKKPRPNDLSLRRLLYYTISKHCSWTGHGDLQILHASESELNTVFRKKLENCLKDRLRFDE